MSYALFLTQRLIGIPSRYDYRYVRRYEPTAESYDFAAILEVTDNPADALHFPTLQAAVDKYLQPVGIRADGLPDRPLTEFSMEVRQIWDDDSGMTTQRQA